MNGEAERFERDLSLSFVQGNTDIRSFDPYAAVIDPNALAGVKRDFRYGCQIGPYRLLLNSGVMSEVRPKADVFPLPNGPRYLTGLTNLRGNLTPVFDAHTWLGLDAKATKVKYMLIIDRGEAAAGFYIDALPVAIDVDKASRVQQPKNFPNVMQGLIGEALSMDGNVWTGIKHTALFERIAREH